MFRREKVDIDTTGEDVFQDEVASSDPGYDENEIKRLIHSGKKTEALQILLSSTPLSSPSKVDLVVSTLMMISSGEIDRVVGQLNQDQVDTLMKYIYKGFENPGECGSSHLLAWHERAFDAGGVGSIVRVLTDRRRVQPTI